LPNRENFVLSRSPQQAKEGIRYFDSLDAALAAVKTEDAFIIGGAEIYRQSLPLIDGAYVTFIHERYEGDAFYPELPHEFVETEYQKLQDEPLIEMRFFLREKAGE
ncbi:MAG: dihydrofolate reductase, partial [Planctomycetaceae bacterium]|nr:dihydrofolate reductase [Planctomycetaceae bacterium]